MQRCDDNLSNLSSGSAMHMVCLQYSAQIALHSGVVYGWFAGWQSQTVGIASE